MQNRKFWVIGVSLSLGLAGCGNEPSKDLNSQIDEGHAVKALQEINAQLADNPTDPVLLALALKATLMACAETDCPVNAPLMLQNLAGYAAQVKTPVALNETTSLKPGDMFRQAAVQLTNLPTAPASVIALYKAAPDAMRPFVADGMFTAPLIQLRNGKSAIAAGQLQAISNGDELARPLRSWALLNYGLITKQPHVVEGAVIGLRSDDKATQLPPAAVRVLPHAMLVPAHNDAAQLAQMALPVIQQWKLPFATESLWTPAAEELNHMRLNSDVMGRLSGSKTQTEMTSATTVFDTSALTQLQLMRLSLALNTNQPELWHTFLPLAAKAQEATPGINLLGGSGAPSNPPADLVSPYMATLFRLLDLEASRNGDMMPLLSQLGSLKLDKPTSVKLEKMVQEGLENAATGRQVEQILAYATFRPEVARNTRQVIVPPLVEAIRGDLQSGNYDRAVQTANLIQDDLGIDFHFDSLITKELDIQMRTDGTLDGLSSDTPEFLLQQAANAQIPLGNLWDFATRYFASKPAVLDQFLKNLVAGARGMYGTPTALYRLQSYFPDSTFPEEARQQYLAKAVGQSLLDDKRLTGPELADLSWRLSRIHTGLMLAPLLDEALNRTDNLDESRTLWQQAPAQVRQTLGTVRPTFASLMRGIDAWEAGRISAAAEAFGDLDATYAGQVAPYLLQLRDKLMGVSGLYATTDPVHGATGLIAIEAPALSGKGQLASVNVTFTNRLGSLTNTDRQTFTTDHAAIRQTTLPLTLDFATLSAAVDDQAKARAGASFDDTFGAISNLRWQDGQLVATTAQGTTLYRPVAAAASGMVGPQGDYMVSRQLSEENPATDVILPPGSLLTLTTTTQPTRVQNGSEDLGEIYKLTATIRHPGMLKPQEVEGYYDPLRHLVNLTFTPPLFKGGEAKAALRCEVLGPALLCGAHHTHSNRAQYVHQVLALQTQESAKQQAIRQNAVDARQMKLWQDLTASQLLQGNATSDVDEDADTAVSGTTVTGEAVVEGSSDELPPPDFLVSGTAPVSPSKK